MCGWYPKEIEQQTVKQTEPKKDSEPSKCQSWTEKKYYWT